MAINKAMRAALKAIAYLNLNVDIKKSYKAERRIENLSAKIQGKPAEYAIWDHSVRNGDYEISRTSLFTQKGDSPASAALFPRRRLGYREH
jgi:hypothetical protein